ARARRRTSAAPGGRRTAAARARTTPAPPVWTPASATSAAWKPGIAALTTRPSAWGGERIDPLTGKPPAALARGRRGGLVKESGAPSRVLWIARDPALRSRRSGSAPPPVGAG